jgi:hypothetical protein
MKRRDFLQRITLSVLCAWPRLRPSAAAAAARFAPSTQGKWVGGGTVDVLGVHGAMMPNGLVLLFGYNHRDHYFDEECGFQLWDPAARAPAGPKRSLQDYNPFCSGHSFLGDDRLFVAGGYKSGDPFRASSADQVRTIAAAGRSVTWQNSAGKMRTCGGTRRA